MPDRSLLHFPYEMIFVAHAKHHSNSNEQKFMLCRVW